VYVLASASHAARLNVTWAFIAVHSATVQMNPRRIHHHNALLLASGYVTPALRTQHHQLWMPHPVDLG
jgi:hypothetical protein